MDRTGRDPQINDPPLTDLGRQQVERSARAFTRSVNLILASPFQRAIETAQICAAVLDVPVLIEPLVGEQRLYSCDVGSPVATLEKKWPHLDFSKVDRGEWWLPFPEPRGDLARRIQAFRTEWGCHEHAARILTVSHWYFINAVTGAHPDNAEVVEEWI